MSKSYFLPNSPKLLSINGVYTYFKRMKDRYPIRGSIITEEKDIEDLIYYLYHHYNDDKGVTIQVDLGFCEFFVDFPPETRNSKFCFWVRDLRTKKAIHFSTSSNGMIPPSVYKNFSDCLKAILIPYKREIRKQICQESGDSYQAVNLWHSEISTKEIIDEFIEQENLSDKLELVISENGLGNNIPELKPEYIYLKEKFLVFYCDKKVKNEINYKLRQRAV